jgi:hypothetical protein
MRTRCVAVCEAIPRIPILSTRKPTGTSFARALGLRFFQILDEDFEQTTHEADKVFRDEEADLCTLQT